MQSLHQVSLQGNAFTGAIPASIANNTSVNVLRLQFNQFDGNVPIELCPIQVLEADCLDDAFLFEYRGVVPDPADPLVADNACPLGCCSRCCNRDTQTCKSKRENGVNHPHPLCMAFHRLNEDGVFV